MDPIYVVIPAGGNSSRMAGVDKLTALLDDDPVIVHTLRAFYALTYVTHIVLATPKTSFDYYNKILNKYAFKDKVTIAESGPTRRHTVYNGLKALRHKNGIVLIHDGARPLITEKTIKDCIEGAMRYGVCVSAVRSVDTVKLADNIMFVKSNLDRDKVFFVQTPQSFKTEIALKLHEQADQDDLQVTDDAMIAEHYGHNVKIVASDSLNIKITSQEDLLLARAILACRD